MSRTKLQINLLLILFFSMELHSSFPTPLSWDYPYIPYNGEYSASVVLTYTPLCILHYKYCYRTTPCCYDFAITEVSLEGDCNQFKNTDTLIKYASRDLISNVNPWGGVIPECPEQSSRHWRQSTATCFTDFYWDPVTLRWTSVPCDRDGQERWCWIYYQYCWYWNNNQRYLRETIIEFNMGGPPCPKFDPYGRRCNQKCQ